MHGRSISCFFSLGRQSTRRRWWRWHRGRRPWMRRRRILLLVLNIFHRIYSWKVPNHDAEAEKLWCWVGWTPSVCPWSLWYVVRGGITPCAQVPPRTTGYLFNFPATLFLVQSYGLYVVEARGAILSVPGLRATSRNILWSTTKVNEACARPPHDGWQKLGYQPIAHTEL